MSERGNSSSTKVVTAQGGARSEPVSGYVPLKWTRSCVRCLEPATFWTGHVIDHLDGKHVLAGWCQLHLYLVRDNGPCFGDWDPRMGKWLLEEGQEKR